MPNSKFRVLLTTALFGMLFLSSRPTFGQTLTPDTANGYPEHSIIHGTEIESVQLNDLNLHIELPIYSSKGRGLDSGSFFVLDTKGWGFNSSCSHGVCTDKPASQPGSNVTLTVHGPADFVLGGL